jgi:tetratricopeptide (TPR) repeat protein
MGHKSRRKRLVLKAPPLATANSTPLPCPVSDGGKHRWTKRLAASVLVPALLLALGEIALRVVGFGYSTNFFQETGDGKTLTTNWKFAWQFYPRQTATIPIPIVFSKQKPSGTKRIFILGESAAAGTPDPAFGFARMLDVMLQDAYPSNHCEVLNVAMRGIDSHIVRQIATECADLSPDLFIIYMGNNEAIGLHAPSPQEFRLTSNIDWLRIQQSFYRLKLAQLGRALLDKAGQNRTPKHDMESFRRERLARDDPKREAVYRNYEINLRDLCAIARRAGADTLICSVAVNLHDFPPLASLHRKDLSADELARWEKFYAAGDAAESARDFAAALAGYEPAARSDEHFADLLFRMARCHEAVGKLEDARRCFSLARDEDALQFRTDSRLNRIVRSVAVSSGPNIHFVDLEKRCNESSIATNGLAGRGIFHEHVHFNFDGDHLVASALVSEVASVLQWPASSRPALSRDECARRLAYTAIDDFNVRASVTRATANPPFLDQIDHAARQSALEEELKDRQRRATTQMFDEALAIYRQATAARPDDWMIHNNFAYLLKQTGRHREAADEFRQAVKRISSRAFLRMAYGEELLASDHAQEAAEQFEIAIKLDPRFKSARDALAVARSRMR